MKKSMIIATMMGVSIFLSVAQSYAFCGFYIAKADKTLFNDRSEVILVRDGNRTVITMSNDFQGDVKDFAMVVPVPVVLQEHQVRVVDRSIFDKLDAYSSPRLVEYYDENPCMPEYEVVEDSFNWGAPEMSMRMESFDEGIDKDYGVSIEASYSVGEYDILILSAIESNGLKRWLLDNDYKIPSTAERVLDPYIKSGLKFFVVKVNLENRLMTSEYLSPIQIEFDSDRFMLPIRLGMANSKGEQDMIVYAFTRVGRVECTNYRTVNMPTDRNIPLFVQPKFGEFYKDVFKRTYKKEGENAVFLEYAWNVSPNAGVKCDPCVGPAPIFQDFQKAGVYWARDMSAASAVHFTRLHVRYSEPKFPQDLFFQVTPNQQNYQARYVLTHPASGDMSCDSGQEYLKNLERRRKLEIDELEALTGWKENTSVNYIQQYSNRIKKNDTWGMPGTNQKSPPKGPWVFTILAVLFILTSWLVIWHQTKKQEVV